MKTQDNQGHPRPEQRFSFNNKTIHIEQSYRITKEEQQIERILKDVELKL